MGKLQTAVTLPKRILLQGWAGDQGFEDINGEYVYGKFILFGPQERSGYIRQGGYLAYMFFNQVTNRWVHYSNDNGWDNPSSNPNVLPLNGWIENNAQGPAGSITVLENISGKNTKISIKKQNLGGGKISLYKTFAPNALQGLSLWLKADTGVTLSGSDVTAWADQSSNGNNASAPTINPTFIASAINSKPAISFNGDDSWMQISQNSIGNSGNITVFVVIDYTSGGIILNKGDGATFEATEWEMAPQNGSGYVRNDGGDFSWNIVSFSPSGLSLITMITTSGITELFNNNTSEGTSSNATPINATSQYIGIGGGGTSGSTQSSLDAKIAEIIIYNRAVTTPERQQVEAYLNEKYAIY